MKVSGWYESDNGAEFIEASGRSIRDIATRILHDYPDAFGADMELTDETGEEVGCSVSRAMNLS